ncbi:MAG: glycosyltransferase [Planctomycetota bacterium]
MVACQDLPHVEQTGWPWTDECGETGDSADGHSEPILVVTPSFNQGEFIEATLRSVLLQKTDSVRYVVVDGGSNDRTPEILERYRPWIDELIIEPDGGQSDAIVKGIQATDRGWFNWINSDDILAPGVLEILRRRSAAECQMVTFPVEVLGDGPTYQIANRNLSAETMLLDGDYSFAQPGCWLRLETLRDVGEIDRNLQYGFDWDLMIRYLASHPIIQGRDEVGATFRVHDASKTATENLKDQHENAFELENARICEKLGSMLPSELAGLAQKGRQRRIWRHRVAEVLDDQSLRPHTALAMLFREAMKSPKTRFGRRTWMSSLRLLSRYVRPNVHQSQRD